MNLAKRNFGSAMSASEYADEWQINADSFTAAGHYVWMSGQLGSQARVLEVGCGSGASTESLLTTCPQVVVAEPNDHFAAKAHSRLTSKGVSCDRLPIERSCQLVDWTTPGVKILGVDALALCTATPHELHGSFDAIVCWLIGSYPDHVGKALRIPVVDLDVEQMRQYRERVHIACLRIGSQLLRSGGVVHLVDRMGLASWNDKNMLRQIRCEAMQSLAGVSYRVDFHDCMLRRMESGLGPSRIQHGSAEFSPTKSVPVLASVKLFRAS